MNDTLRLGAIVTCPDGPGTVVDRSAGQSLVRLETGTVLDTTHGQWWPDTELTVTGYDPEAMVWRGQRVVPAGDIERTP